MSSKDVCVVTRYKEDTWYDAISHPSSGLPTAPEAPYGYRLEVETCFYTGFIEKFKFVREPEKREYTHLQVKAAVVAAIHKCADVVEREGHSLHYELRGLTQDRSFLLRIINEAAKN